MARAGLDTNHWVEVCGGWGCRVWRVSVFNKVRLVGILRTNFVAPSTSNPSQRCTGPEGESLGVALSPTKSDLRGTSLDRLICFYRS